MELTILIPALNEEKTIGIVVEKALKWIKEKNINGEVLVVNNGSIDKTKEIALKLGARVVDFAPCGYGLALRKGIEEAYGKYVIMGDADDSYNFLEIDGFLEKLKRGYDIVIGNRYLGKMEKGAMKWTHKYIGTPLFSFMIIKKYGVKIGDINCGLRGGVREKLLSLNCKSTGMEYASEMIIKASKEKLNICEIPINFYKDKREGKSNLKTIRDGLRHLSIILINKREKNKTESNKDKKYNIKKYITSFIVIVILCLISLVLVTMLPDNKVKEHCKEIAKSYAQEKTIIPEIKMGISNTMLDNYANAKSISIIYSLDREKPLSSVLEAKYYEENMKSMTKCLLELVNGEKEPNQEYTRYWHGYIVILKPLLMFFNENGIYIFIGIILLSLILLIIKELWKIDKRTIIAFIIGLYMITIWVVPICFEYMWAIIMSFVISLIVLKKDNGENKKIYYYFWITGILTCFFDFLTVELLTVLLPLMFIFIKRNKEGKLGGFKEIIIFIIKSLIIWGLGYILMFVVKWIIASIVLGRNCIIEAIEKAEVRVNGQIGNIPNGKIWLEVIRKNFNNLQPIFYIRKKYIVYVLIPTITIIMLLINKYKNKTNTYVYSLIILGLIPYIRYSILLNHSYRHFFFTFRLQLVTVMAFVLVLLNVFKRKNKIKT